MNHYLKRNLSIWIGLLVCFFATTIYANAAEITDSGSCGDNLTWTFRGDDEASTGELIISGTGEMKCPEGKYGDWPWYQYHSLITNIIIEEGVTSIGENAFYKCSASELILPSTLEKIEPLALQWLRGLQTIEIPQNVTEIGECAFGTSRSEEDQCLVEINVAKENKIYASMNGVLFDKKKQTLICYPWGKSDYMYKVPESVTTIGNSAFYRCENLKNLILPPGLLQIGNSAFSCCLIESIKIPESVTSIGAQAFFSSSIRNIEIPEGISEIRYSTFSQCYNLIKVVIPKSVKIIEDEVFRFSKNVIIYGASNSYAEKYANEQKIPFVEAEAEQNSADRLTTSFPELSIVESNGAEYTLKDAEAEISLLVIGRVTCPLTKKEVNTSLQILEELGVENGRVYLLDVDQSQETVKEYADSHPGVHAAYSTDSKYNHLYFEIKEACNSDGATFPAVCILNNEQKAVFCAHGDSLGKTAMKEAIATITGKEPLKVVGDLNHDGMINLADLNIIWNEANYNKPTSEAAQPEADVNDDGIINLTDLNFVWNEERYNKAVSVQ